MKTVLLVVFALSCEAQILSPIVANVSHVASGNGYSWKRTITIDHTQVPNTDQTNFPVLISGTFADLKTTGNGGAITHTTTCCAAGATVAADVIFTTDSPGVVLTSWDTETYSATTGAVNIWVLIPSVSHTVDTVFYMFYGNSSITTYQSTYTSTWNSAFKGRYHLPNGTAYNLNDSTINALNLTTDSGNETAVTGKVDGAVSFNGINGFIASMTQLPFTAGFTVGMWVNPSALPSVSFIADRYNSSTALIQFFSGNGTASDLSFRLRGDNGVGITSVVASGVLATSTWAHIVGVRDTGSTLLRIYINGTQSNTAVDATTGTITWDGPQIAAGFGTASTYAGTVDEIEFSNVIRSADWIAADYASQNNPSSFAAVGSAVAN